MREAAAAERGQRRAGTIRRSAGISPGSDGALQQEQQATCWQAEPRVTERLRAAAAACNTLERESLMEAAAGFSYPSFIIMLSRAALCCLTPPRPVGSVAQVMKTLAPCAPLMNG